MYKLFLSKSKVPFVLISPLSAISKFLVSFSVNDVTLEPPSSKEILPIGVPEAISSFMDFIKSSSVGFCMVSIFLLVFLSVSISLLLSLSASGVFLYPWIKSLFSTSMYFSILYATP